MCVGAPWFGYLSRFNVCGDTMWHCQGLCLPVYVLCVSMCGVFARQCVLK